MDFLYFELKINTSFALTGVAQWAGHCPANRKVTGSIPSQGTCLVVGQVPGWGCGRGNRSMFLSLIDVSLSLFLTPSPFL